MNVLFCHGLETGPHGRKFHALVEAGFDVHAPDCRGEDLAQRITRLHEAIVGAPMPPLVVGSSFGGIAGLLAAMQAKAQGVQVPAIVLCAPALKVPRPPAFAGPLECPAPTIIVHGTRDEVIPIAVSREYAQAHGAELVEVDDEHSLANSLDEIIAAVRKRC